MSQQEGLVNESPERYFENLIITEDYSLLKDCKLVIECTLENIDIKKTVYQKIEAVIDKDVILTSNTSAIPISILQQHTIFPHRFFGLHSWRNLPTPRGSSEIICGDSSELAKGETYKLSHAWGKEPTLVRKDIRGFITNRLMYAMYREAFNLVENGYATVEDVDSCLPE